MEYKSVLCFRLLIALIMTAGAFPTKGKQIMRQYQAGQSRPLHFMLSLEQPIKIGLLQGSQDL